MSTDWTTYDSAVGTAFVAKKTAMLNQMNVDIPALEADVLALQTGTSFTGTSVTSETIGTGSKTFTIVETLRSWGIGSELRITDDANVANYMIGNVTSYSGTTLIITINITGGSGTKTAWTITAAVDDQTKADKKILAATGNIFISDASGNLDDSTYKPTTLPVSTPQQTALDLKIGYTNILGKNLLINANGITNQRVYVSATATSGANEYTLDRWNVVTSGQNLTFSTTANLVTFTCPAGGLSQKIEGENIQSGTYVVNWEGTATCTVDAVSKSKGDTFTLTGGTDAEVIFSNGTMSKPQIELGTEATEFDIVDIATQIVRCQRYYVRLTRDSSSGNLGTGESLTTANARIMWLFPTIMRTAPTLSYADTASIGIVPTGLGGQSSNAISFDTPNPLYGTRITATKALANLTVGETCSMSISGGKWIAADSEL